MINWLKKVSSKKILESSPTIFSHSAETSRQFVVYDCEIVNCIPTGSRSPDFTYCQGWKDFTGMEISVIAAYSSWDDAYHIYLQDNLAAFEVLVKQANEVVGFNSVQFDDNLCAAHGLNVTTTYDLLCEIRVAAGMPPHYVKGVTRGGYSLEALAKTNLGIGKSGSGALAPQLWQQGQYGKVIDYCLGDVAITRKLYQRRYQLVDPTNGQLLSLR